MLLNISVYFQSIFIYIQCEGFAKLTLHLALPSSLRVIRDAGDVLLGRRDAAWRRRQWRGGEEEEERVRRAR